MVLEEAVFIQLVILLDFAVLFFLAGTFMDPTELLPPFELHQFQVVPEVLLILTFVKIKVL